MEFASTARRQDAPSFRAFDRLSPKRASAEPPAHRLWPQWQRILFRFFFVYFVLEVAPWHWFRAIPGVPFVLGYYGRAVSRAVHLGNNYLFHVRLVLVPTNGSGDTSYAWAQLWLFLALAAVVCVFWTAIDWRRSNYARLAYWLRLIVRYYIATAALSYGIIKLYVLQMPFPTLSQLATPLGDLLPMRLSWLFIGYSPTYQFFSGVMETLAGLLLLYSGTVTAGLLLAAGAFLNVLMINVAYDVPVKLYAMQLLFSCVFLLALDSRRLVGFLVLNQGAPPTSAYDLDTSQLWVQLASVAVKVFILFQILIFPLKDGWASYQAANAPADAGPFRPGVYDVRRYVVNHDTVPVTSADSLRWRDVIFDNKGAGSVNTTDGVFWQRYHRGYFRYASDAKSHTAAVWKTSTVPRDSTYLFTMRYEVPDSLTVRLHMTIRRDSIHVELVRVPRHFQLTERQFHWLSEYNR